MERYNKYLVLKIADIRKYLSDEQQLKLDALNARIRVGRLNDGKQDQQYVCVAADWPMYEQVWGMIEAFVDNKPSEIEQLTARVRELEEENARLLAAMQQPDRHAMQLEGKHPSPCAKFCEAPAFLIQERGLRKQLAASQAYAEQLRKALESCYEKMKQMCLNGEWYAPDKAIDLAYAALTLPRDTSALDAYVSDKVKEAVSTQKGYYESVFQDGAKRISTLTRQGDLAVEALEAMAQDGWLLCGPEGLSDAQKKVCEALSTIKESEVK